MNEQHWEQEACPKYDCRKENCKCGMKKVFLATALGDDSEDSPIAPKNGAYCNAIVVYEANEHVYIYSTEGIPTLVEYSGKKLEKLVEELEDGLAKEILDRQAADNSLQQEIDDIKNSPDVVDIVATYAALQAYDTSHLGNNDIIRVLEDETHDGQSTYYRWNKTTSTWTYIGAVGDYYTKTQVDTLLNAKQNTLTAGDNITINGNVISANGGIFLVRASETTSQSQTPEGSDLQDYAGQTGLYVNDVYLDPNTPGLGNIYYVYSIGVDPETEDPYAEYALIANMQEAWTAIASIDNMMPIGGAGAPDSSTPGQPGQLYIDVQNYVLYVCIDDSNPYVWQQLGGGPTVVQATGTSTTDVMSQDATTKMIYPTSIYSISIGNNTITTTSQYYTAICGSIGSTTDSGIAIGSGSSRASLGGQSRAYGGIVIGGDASSPKGYQNIVIGRNAYANPGVDYTDTFDVAIGANSIIMGTSSDPIKNAVALGSYAKPTRSGEVNVGTGTETLGYNSTSYRIIGGVHDPVDAHDAATKGYVDANAGGDTVYSNKNTSDNATGGAVYIGNLDANQDEQPDPTATDRNWKYFWALPYSNSITPVNNSINILGSITSGGVNMAIGAEATARGNQSIALGYRAQTVQSSLAIGASANAGNGDTNRIGVTAIGYSAVARADYSIAIGGSTGNSYGVFNTNSTGSITIGKNAQVGNGSNGYKNSIALGSYAQATRQGEVNVGLVTGETTGGYNSTAYRVIGGVHDGEQDHDAVTIHQINQLIDIINLTLNVNIQHIGS